MGNNWAGRDLPEPYPNLSALFNPSPKMQGPTIITTGHHVLERERCMCPRFGDSYYRTEKADVIKNDVAFYKIKKAADKELDTLDLAGCSFNFLPDELGIVNVFTTTLVDLNLARNNLFGSDSAFSVLKNLTSLKRLR